MSALPLVPDADEARRWAEQELSDPAYRVAEPTPFDRFAGAVADAIAGLFDADGAGGWGPWLAVGAVVIVAALVVLGLVALSRPNRAGRTRRQQSTLLEAVAATSAAGWEEQARAHAADGRWDDAVLAGFHAVAASLADNGAVRPDPGTTAQEVARAGSRALPAASALLSAAANDFDDVRYLRRRGDAAAYERTVAALRAVRVPVDAAR